ncbi:MerR family transcriptional regulator [Naumannella cuiyingiana]|uniref:DNA-binding transcriptional MerR regulator n=1 Tax=Naumannella cuiyingiana TaxID=1347891 RepID=A0A7Z0ILI9_9ACTN|nr:MerR family transcriptional regulator [Naumannella cuiyingiana]NYI71643.1 DNA-binding transcriptional MerR regulator [Naumannella cuiyingiana]
MTTTNSVSGLRIGDLAAATGASARSLRYYEQQELITSERSLGGQRHYDDATVERVRLIRQLLAAGLGTETIREVLPCVHDPAARTPWLAERLAAELDRIDDRIDCLQRTRTTLAAVIKDYRAG